MPFSARTGFFSQASTPPASGYPDWPTQATQSEFDTEVALYSGAVGTLNTGGPSTGGYGTCLGGLNDVKHEEDG